MGEELEAAADPAKGTEKIVAWKDKYSGIRPTGPSRCATSADVSPGSPAQISMGTYDAKNRSSCRSRRQALPVVAHSRSAVQRVIIYIDGVSGSMGDEQKEIVRIESFWIDTWLQSQTTGDQSLHHPPTRWPRRSDPTPFFPPASRAATMISSGTSCAPTMISDDTRRSCGTSTVPLLDGDMSVDDTHTCVDLSRRRAAHVNLSLRPGRVAVRLGSVIKDLDRALRRRRAGRDQRDQGKDADHGLDQRVPWKGP